MKIIDKFISFMAPHYCIICGYEGTILCEPCYQAEVVKQVPSCYLCVKATVDFDVCKNCESKTPIRRLYTATYLDKNIQKLIYRLKFDRTYSVAHRIAEILDDFMPRLSSEAVITYVPSSPKRIRSRGYDHAGLIAKDFAKRRKLECTPLLIKTNNLRQVGADKKLRFEQANKSYQLRNSLVPKESKIILVDDIVTTGATLGACTSLLKKAGFKDVECLVFANKD